VTVKNKKIAPGMLYSYDKSLIMVCQVRDDLDAVICINCNTYNKFTYKISALKSLAKDQVITIHSW
jgi:hypothetical protein